MAARSASAQTLGGIEAGGTKFVCVIGRGPGEVHAEVRIPTSEPAHTIPRVIDFFQRAVRQGERISSIGIASFGPLELRHDHPKFGFITNTPKPGWTDTDLAGEVRRGLDLPVAIDSDVNGAALGEARWGAARDLRTFVYVTIGTGIGGGAVVDGKPLRGLVHPEMGHLPVRRQASDPFPGLCPYHGDCWEGMASGPAIEARWNRTPPELKGRMLVSALALEAAYVAGGLLSIIYALAPERILLGGGVTRMPGFMGAVRKTLGDLASYPGLSEHLSPDFVVPPLLGTRAGAMGALVLAAEAAGIREGGLVG